MIAEGEKPGEDEEALWYLRRLDGGLFTLQTVDYILAWLTMEDDGVGCIYARMFTNLTRTNPRSNHISSKCSVAKTSRCKIWSRRYRSIMTMWTNQNRLTNQLSHKRLSCRTSWPSSAVHDRQCVLDYNYMLYLLFCVNQMILGSRQGDGGEQHI